MALKINLPSDYLDQFSLKIHISPLQDRDEFATSFKYQLDC